MTHSSQQPGEDVPTPQRSLSQSKAELCRLVSLSSDGLLDSANQSRLEALLRESPELVEDYASLVATEALVELSVGKTSLDLDALREASEHPPAVGPPRAVHTSTLASLSKGLKANESWQSGLSMRRWLPLAVAATLLLAAGAWLLNRPGAYLVASEAAQWADGQARELGSPLERGWLTLESGEVRLAFKSGAMTSIRGPARFRASSGNYGQLQYGVISAHVPEGATGFTVNTPTAAVVDLGTGYRLQVSKAGGLNLHVTEGKVRLEPSQTGTEELELSAGQIAINHQLDEPFSISEDASITGSKNVAFYAQHPTSLGYNAFDHDDQLAVFLESHAIRLTEEIRLNVSKPGKHDQLNGTAETIPEGRLVSSYLVHCAPVRLRHIVEGKIRFPGKVLGIISNSDSLNATNPMLGATWTLQCSHVERGLESAPDYNSDVVTISKDRHTLALRLRTESIDQLRVIVASE